MTTGRPLPYQRHLRFSIPCPECDGTVSLSGDGHAQWGSGTFVHRDGNGNETVEHTNVHVDVYAPQHYSPFLPLRVWATARVHGQNPRAL